ncbi:MAG: hypothetical protein NUW22_14215 [Acidobacteria bacterium]|nr:hypothetical protein [Acidobacteriota bacterium]
MNIKGKGGELRATIHVKRAGTGKVDTYELVGGCSLEEARALGAKIEHGASGGLVGQGAAMNNQPKES